MNITIENETEDSFDFDYEEIITKVIDEAISYVDLPYEAEVSVTITDSDRIKEINSEFRHIDKPTDVLSFPMIEYEKEAYFEDFEQRDDLFNPETGELMLGDIVLNIDRVKSQALEYGHSQIRELAFLTAHSMLHLFGYDHMKDDERIIMEKKQEEILSALSISR